MYWYVLHQMESTWLLQQTWGISIANLSLFSHLLSIKFTKSWNNILAHPASYFWLSSLVETSLVCVKHLVLNGVLHNNLNQSIDVFLSQFLDLGAQSPNLKNQVLSCVKQMSLDEVLDVRAKIFWVPIILAKEKSHSTHDRWGNTDLINQFRLSQRGIFLA